MTRLDCYRYTITCSCDLLAQRRGAYSQRNYVMIFDKEGSTALHIAVQNGNLNVSCHCCVLLVDHGNILNRANNLSSGAGKSALKIIGGSLNHNAR